MALDPRAARFIAMLSAGTTQARTIESRRAGLAALMKFAKAEAMSAPGQDFNLSCGVGIRIYTPAADAILPVIVFFHGGGLVAGSIDTQDVVTRGLCAASGCKVISVDYRLAPEHPLPAALDDAVASVREIKARAGEFKIDANRIALCGESGGAALAVCVAQDVDVQLLHLICPVLDWSVESASRREFAKGYLIDREVMEADFADLTQGKIARDDPRVSPLLLKDLSKLPPTIVHTAECDPLRDEGEAFAQRVKAKLIRHEGMLHNFHAMGAVVPQGAAALTEMGAEMGLALKAGRA